jgi:hypothetical protein
MEDDFPSLGAAATVSPIPSPTDTPAQFVETQQPQSKKQQQKKPKAKLIPLDAFLEQTGLGGGSWADEMESMPTARMSFLAAKSPKMTPGMKKRRLGTLRSTGEIAHT